MEPRSPFSTRGAVCSRKRRQSAASCRRIANPGRVASVLLRSHPELFRLTTIQFIGYTAHEVVQIYVLYAIYRYAWEEKTVGLSLAFVGVCTVLISAGMVRPLVAWLANAAPFTLVRALALSAWR